MRPGAYLVCRIAVGILAALPWTGLLWWMGRPESVAWAHGFWSTPHPLNFGGNPSEAYSHLLNWITFQSGLFVVLVGAIPSWDALAAPPRDRWGRVLPALLAFGIAWSGILGFATVLDARDGEGTVLPSGLFFDLPTLLAIGGAERLFGCLGRRGFRWFFVLLLAPAGLGAQAIFEPSDRGSMNLWGLVLLPILAFGAWLACWAGYRWGIRPR